MKNVHETTVVFLQNRVFRRQIQRIIQFHRILKASMCKSFNWFIGIVPVLYDRFFYIQFFLKKLFFKSIKTTHIDNPIPADLKSYTYINFKTIQIISINRVCFAITILLKFNNKNKRLTVVRTSSPPLAGVKTVSNLPAVSKIWSVALYYQIMVG